MLLIHCTSRSVNIQAPNFPVSSGLRNSTYSKSHRFLCAPNILAKCIAQLKKIVLSKNAKRYGLSKDKNDNTKEKKSFSANKISNHFSSLLYSTDKPKKKKCEQCAKRPLLTTTDYLIPLSTS